MSALALEALVDLTNALSATSRGLGSLLTALDGGLHVVAATLELAWDPLGRHLSFEVLDRAVETTLAHVDFDGPTLYWVANFTHERAKLAYPEASRKLPPFRENLPLPYASARRGCGPALNATLAKRSSPSATSI